MTLQQQVKTDARQVELEYNRAVKELAKGNEVPLLSFSVVYADIPQAQAMVAKAQDALELKHHNEWIRDSNEYN